jgi:hypothetical protein
MSTSTDSKRVWWGCGGLAVLVPALIFDSYVITRLWTWFAVPLGVPAIGLAHAAGLTTLVATIRFSAAAAGNRSASQSTFTDEQRLVDIRSTVLGMVIVPAVSLGVGYLAHWFMVQP